MYNEIAPYPAQWIRNLVEAGHIAPGRVVETSIVGLVPQDVQYDTQAHFFAGIGVWSAAARAAGWPDAAELWSGSCPCQPFSSAGRKRGIEDVRHLWPEWYRLILACRPPVIVGEQVASPDGLGWLDVVFADLEKAGYTVRAFDLCAAGVGAPHLRQRLYFVAVTDGERLEGVRLHLRQRRSLQAMLEACGSGEFGLVGDAVEIEHEGRSGIPESILPGSSGDTRLVGDASGEGSRRHARAVLSAQGECEGQRFSTRDLPDELGASGATGGFWGDAEWLACRDAKLRPVEPGTFPLVDGSPSELGRDRAARIAGAGNAIVRPLAQIFLEAVIDTLLETP